MKKTIFKNGTIATEEKMERKDILVEGSKIIGVDESIDNAASAEIIDCTNCVILPGLFDMHTHLREPGREDEETIESGSEAALNGGITGIVTMPNTNPSIDTGTSVRYLKNIAESQSRIPVYITGCITKNRDGENIAEIGDMFSNGAIMITDDGSTVSNSLILRRAMEYSKNFDIIVALHSETNELSADGVVNEGETSTNLGLPGIPYESETICIERDMYLAELTGARVHIQHISSAESLNIIKRFKDKGIKVTCEVTPHHLLLTEKDIKDYNTNYKMNPPLRTEEDREVLIQGIKDGTIDCIATDHAPHSTFEKKHDFLNAPFGITGLETALITLFSRLVKTNKLEWKDIVRSFSVTPRKILGLKKIEIKQGSNAEFVVFNTEKLTNFNKKYFKSKSLNTPFLNNTENGYIEKVIYNGEILVSRNGYQRN